MNGPTITPFSSDVAWPVPEALCEALHPVPEFDPHLLPDALRGWVNDIQDRMQCPMDFPAVAAMVAAGSLIGAKVGIRPKRHDDWLLAGNIWGLLIGRPSTMKSPSMSEVLKPLRRIDKKATEANAEADKTHAKTRLVYEARKKAADLKAKDALKKDPDADVSCLYPDEPPKPSKIIKLINDATYEALGVAVGDNPDGLLVERDEIMGLLSLLRRDEKAADRAFYLTGWNGTQPHKFSRIQRGEVILPNVCLSLLGGTQPGKISEFVRDANKGGSQDDGLLQRFGMSVWPDLGKEFQQIDRHPDSMARTMANETFDRLASLTAESVGATLEPFARIPSLRFEEAAQDHFLEWLWDAETELRSGELSPALESHFGKHKSLVPQLALICHIVDGHSGPVGLASLLRALSWVEHLREHAKRLYGAALQPDREGARTLWKRIKAGKLGNHFTTRDVYRPQWTGLTNATEAKGALVVLLDHGLVVSQVTQTGGAPSEVWLVNPRGLNL
jgi:putative DNA primase/helicase